MKTLNAAEFLVDCNDDTRAGMFARESRDAFELRGCLARAPLVSHCTSHVLFAAFAEEERDTSVIQIAQHYVVQFEAADRWKEDRVSVLDEIVQGNISDW